MNMAEYESDDSLSSVRADAGKIIPMPPEMHLLPQPKQIHVIYLESDLRADDSEKVTLETNLNDLPPHRGRYEPTQFSDEIRYNEYENELEKTVFRPITMPESQQTVVRDRANADFIFAEMLENMDKAGESR